MESSNYHGQLLAGLLVADCLSHNLFPTSPAPILPTGNGECDYARVKRNGEWEHVNGRRILISGKAERAACMRHTLGLALRVPGSGSGPGR